MIPVFWLLVLAQNAYVTTGGGVVAIDTGSGKITATLALSAGNAAVAPNGAMLYVTQTASNTVAAVNTATNQTVAKIAVGNGPAVAAVSPDSSRVYVTNMLDGTVSAINAATNSVIATVMVGARPFGVAVSVDGTKVYVANTGGPSISVIDTSRNAVSSTIQLPFPASPRMPALSPDGRKAYVTDSNYGSVYVISTATDTVTSTFQAAANNEGVAFSPNGAQAYVTNLEGSVYIVDAARDTVTGTVMLGGSPAGVGFSPDGTKAYVANNGLSEVQVINTGTLAVTAIATPGQPTGFGIFVQPGGPPEIAAVANGFTFQNGFSPGAFIVLAGTNLASLTASFTGTTLPTAIGATSVLLNGIPIRLYYVSPTQINAQLPVDTAVTLSSLEVVNGIEVSDPEQVAIAEASPGIPYYVTNGANHASARNGDNSINSPTNPAAAGSLVTIYLTGMGPVTNPVEAGVPAPESRLAVAELPVSVNMGGKMLVPIFAGLSPGSIGLAQVNVQVPALAPGDYPVTVTIGVAVSNAPLISVGK
jgi:uncharacterized protein (TIGR03437 family)